MFGIFPQLFDADADGEQFAVIHCRQSDSEDVFAVLDKNTGQVTYETFSRSMGQTAENVLSYYE